MECTSDFERASSDVSEIALNTENVCNSDTNNSDALSVAINSLSYSLVKTVSLFMMSHMMVTVCLVLYHTNYKTMVLTVMI